MDLGFFGLGHMGEPMARNLLRAGHALTVYNRTRHKAEALAGAGAQVAERPADACRGQAVITMLADDAAVEKIVFGEGGVLSALGRGKAHVSMSTISVQLSDRLITVVAFVFLMGAWAIVSGLLLWATAFRLNLAHGRWFMALSGAVSVVWGVLLLVWPLTGAIVLTWWMGGYALVFGIALLILSFQLRRRRHEMSAGPVALHGI